MRESPLLINFGLNGLRAIFVESLSVAHHMPHQYRAKSGREYPVRWERLTSLATMSSPRERVLGTCVRPGVAEPDCEPVEG